jgi:hypothetical protein
MSEYDNHSIQSLNDDQRNYMADTMDNYSIVTDSSDEESFEQIPTKKRRNKRMSNSDETKVKDTGYHKVTRRQDGMKIKTEVYSTSFVPGTMIRDAITGIRYSQYRIGSWHEDLFFKVKDTCGYIGDGTYLLFYESPEQCERHMKVKISTNVKKTWTDKFVKAKSMV